MTARCTQCEALMINGVYCHELGCPNTGARWIDGEMVRGYECRECGGWTPKGESCNCMDPYTEDDDSFAD